MRQCRREQVREEECRLQQPSAEAVRDWLHNCPDYTQYRCWFLQEGY